MNSILLYSVESVCFDLCCESQKELFDMRRLYIKTHRISLSNQVLNACVWNEEMFTEQTFKLGIDFGEAKRLCEP